MVWAGCTSVAHDSASTADTLPYGASLRPREQEKDPMLESSCRETGSVRLAALFRRVPSCSVVFLEELVIGARNTVIVATST